AFDEMNSVQERFGKTSGNIAYHAYQSFKTGEVTPELCHKIGVELARKMWGSEYQVLVATHFNTGTYHNHFVVNSVNMWTGKKFNCNKGAYYKFRELSDSLCFEYGLSLIRNPSGKTPRSIYFAEKNGEPTTFNVMREAIDFAINHCRGFPDFKYLMKEQGYAVNVNSTRKYWTIQSVNSQKSVRMYRLGENYSNESIVRRIKEMGNRGWRNFAEYEQHKRELKTFKPRTIVFRGSFKRARKITGLYAKYLHYLYLLGKLPRYTQRKPLSPEMKEAWRHIDRITRQVTLVSKQNFKHLQEVEWFVLDTEQSILDITKHRTKIYNKLRRCTDETERAKLFENRNNCTALLKQLRKDKKIALTILEDYPKMNRNICIEMQAQNLALGRKTKTRKKEYVR
ncbi:MAG: relaxase/mobilization nuclease domain-containing protein, partial [Acutalibacteraceae bacterium]|nr:relaxase/mobilization nuclease domain-containing protein [Acutalibacteraceae bacterium]